MRTRRSPGAGLLWPVFSLLILVFGPAPSQTGMARAAPPPWSATLTHAGPSGTYEYTIRHPLFGQIGTYRARFSRHGGETLVEGRMRLVVEAPLVTLYRFASDSREVWRDNRLVSLETVTNDDGRRLTVSAHAQGDDLVVERPQGQIATAGQSGTTNFWNQAVLGAPNVLEPTSGRIYAVGITARGAESIETPRGSVIARKYEISGEISGNLWYAPDGTWLRMEFEKYGSTLTLALASVTR